MRTVQVLTLAVALAPLSAALPARGGLVLSKTPMIGVGIAMPAAKNASSRVTFPELGGEVATLHTRVVEVGPGPTIVAGTRPRAHPGRPFVLTNAPRGD